MRPDRPSVINSIIKKIDNDSIKKEDLILNDYQDIIDALEYIETLEGAPCWD